MPGPATPLVPATSPTTAEPDQRLQLADAGLHHPLLVLGRVVVGVLADVTVLASRADGLGDAFAPLGLEAVGSLDSRS